MSDTDFPIVDPSRAIVVYVRVEDLNNFFKYSLNADGMPTYLGFDATSTATTTSLSNFYSNTLFIDDSENTVITPVYDICAFEHSLALDRVNPAFTRLWGCNLNQFQVPITSVQESPAQNTVVGPYTLSGSWSDVSGGDAMIFLYNDLSSNGRILSTDANALSTPYFAVGDSLRYFVNVSEAVDIGYHWSQTSFSTICSAQFALTNFCGARLNNSPFGINFTLNPPGIDYALRNGTLMTNVVYSVTMVALYP